MKIGIISMQRVYNYGSFLQAYALKSILENMGHIVSFIDIEKNKEVQKCTDENLFSKLKKVKYIDRYFFKRLELRKKNIRLNELFREVQQRVLNINLHNSMESVEGFDCVVIGSDEIFNCDPNSVWGISQQRFGKIDGVSKVFSYAASCGYTNQSLLNENEKNIIADSLKAMIGISVRDRNTYEFVEELTGKKPEINLDPVLMYDFESEMNNVDVGTLPQEPYMVVYAYHNRIHKKEEIYYIKKYAKKRGLKTISIGGSLPWCDDFVVLSPFEVLMYFKHAACIVTDTFHGSVIAAKFNKALAILVRESNRNKLQDLIDRLNIGETCVMDIRQLGSILDTPIDYSVTNSIIKKETEQTKVYLEKLLCR